MPAKLVLIGCEPVLFDLLLDQLTSSFEIVATARTPSAALQAARHPADVVLLDADLPRGEPNELIAKLALISAAPIVAFSAFAAPGGAGADALLAAGAEDVVAKAAGPLALDLTDEVGQKLLTSLTRMAR